MFSFRRILFLGVILLDAQMGMVADESRKATIDNGVVKLVLVSDGKEIKESYYARSSNGWKLVLENGSSFRPDPALKASGTGTSKAAIHRIERTSQQTRVVLKVQTGQHSLTKVISMKKDDPFVHVVLRDSVRRQSRVEYFLSTYSFLPDGKRYSEYKPLDFVFTPQLRPERDEVIADHTFRSPALVMQEGDVFAALIPDIRSIDGKNRRLKSSADMQVETSSAPFMSFGLMNWVRKKAHVYYAHNDSLAVNVSDTTLSFGYYLYVSTVAPPRRGFQDVVRFEWREFGHPNFAKPVGPQSLPFSAYVQKAWYDYVPKIALSAEYKGKQVTLLRQERLAWSNSLPKVANNDCWFNVWFNSLRTAYGMFVYGQEVGDTELMNKAVGTLDLALLAPQRNGIAPSIFYVDSTGGHWIADHAWGGISHGEHCSAFHNSWTNYWLLEWSDLLPNRRDEILHYTNRFAEFLLENQQVSGVIPSWYDSLTLAPIETFRDTNAETAGAALFLAEMYSRTKQPEYLHAAEKAMQYIFTSILPENKWFDFETFFSCSRKPVGFFDAYTQQHPQNTLSMFMAAEACYTLYRLTNELRYKETGVSIMDYLCLYQQVWSPDWLSRELLGGFGVQNTDGEWSDSRQGYVAVTLMNYYELTKRREYFERGVAALRAMFSLFESDDSPRTAENYAHGSVDQLAGVTGIHWGTGSSVVSIHLIRQRYGDAFINVQEGWGCGIDGCRLDNVVASGNEIQFSIRDVVRSPRQILLKFGDISAQTYKVSMNGIWLGEYSAAQLSHGIMVQI
jgi:hypothetical protein